MPYFTSPSVQIVTMTPLTSLDVLEETYTLYRIFASGNRMWKWRKFQMNVECDP